MSNIIKYNDYYAKIEYSTDDDILFGTIQGIVDVIVFEGESIKDIKKAFKNAVDDYLELCNRIGKKPNKAFKGNFNVRITSELHKAAVQNAARQDVTLNEYVAKAIEEKVKGKGHKTLNIRFEFKNKHVSSIKDNSWSGIKETPIIPYTGNQAKPVA